MFLHVFREAVNEKREKEIFNSVGVPGLDAFAGIGGIAFPNRGQST